MKKIRRIPTILALLFLLVSLGGGIILIKEGRHWFLRAGPEIIPKQVKITNITESGFTVSWITDGPTSGFINYGTDKNLSFTAKDDRDQLSGKTDSFLTHHVTIKNLQPATLYFFKLGSGRKLFDNNGQAYQVTTAPMISQEISPPNDVAYGVVTDQSGAPAEGVIVYLSLANATPQSTLTKSSGSWVIPLNLIRSRDLSSYLAYDPEAAVEEIFVQGASLGTATAVTTSQNDSPVPNIILGQAFDFRKSREIVSSSTPSASKRVSFREITASSVSILNLNPGEKINNPKPEILGRGPAGKTIKITLESTPIYEDEILVDSSGLWSWSPPANLEPGEHTVTITYLDENGQEQTISRSFVVLAAGTSDLPAFTATPSATITPTPTASPTPTPTTSPSGRVSIPSTEEGVPTSGYLTPTFLISIMGIGLAGLGVFIDIFLKRYLNG